MKKSSVQVVEVTDDYVLQRIDNFLLNKLKGIPKSVVYRIVRKGEVRVNKKRIKPDYKLQMGDLVRIPPVQLPERETHLPAATLDSVASLEDAILFEDKHFLIINKPSGMAVHGGSGLSFGLIEALRSLRPNERQLELVHRLDRDTSGCLIVAKKRSALRYFHEQLRLKTMEKNYKALVQGQWQTKHRKVIEPLRKNTLKSGERVVRVDEEQGKYAETRFRVLERFEKTTLVQAFPVTGRTHQIRVHTACKGCAIAGDVKYGEEQFNQSLKAVGLNRLFLHAFSLKFIHPVTEKEMYVEAPLESSLEKVLQNLRRQG